MEQTYFVKYSYLDTTSNNIIASGLVITIADLATHAEMVAACKTALSLGSTVSLKLNEVNNISAGYERAD